MNSYFQNLSIERGDTGFIIRGVGGVREGGKWGISEPEELAKFILDWAKNEDKSKDDGV